MTFNRSISGLTPAGLSSTVIPEAKTILLTTDAGEYKVCAARIEPVEKSTPEKVFPGAYAAALEA